MTKLFLRPLFGGLLFGSFLGLCFWTIFKSFVVGMLIWLAFGGTFGLFMETFDIVTTKWLTKKLTKYGNYEWMRPHHERGITLSIPYEKAFELCSDVVKSLSRCKVQEVNKAIFRVRRCINVYRMLILVRIWKTLRKFHLVLRQNLKRI